MKKRFIGLAISMCFLATMFAGCGTRSTNQEQANFDKATEEAVKEDPKLIKVAIALPLSGQISDLGTTISNGAQMAFEEKKEDLSKLGFEFKLEVKDDVGEVKIATNIAHSLVTDKNVLGIVGHYNSGISIPASEIYNAGNLVMISPGSTGVDVTDRELSTVNRICARDDVQGPSAAKFVFHDLKAKSAFIIYDKKTYGQGIANQFKDAFGSLGGKVVGFEGVNPEDTDFSGVLNMVFAKKPQVVFFGGEYPAGGLIIKQMRAKKINAKFIGADGIDSPQFVEIGGKAVVGSYYTSVASELKSNVKAAGWTKKYEQRFNKKAENWSLYGYDAMNVLLEGIERAINSNNGQKPSRYQVASAVRAIKDFKGLATNVTFNSKGDNEEAALFIYSFEKAEYPASAIKSISAKSSLKK